MWAGTSVFGLQSSADGPRGRCVNTGGDHTLNTPSILAADSWGFKAVKGY